MRVRVCPSTPSQLTPPWKKSWPSSLREAQNLTLRLLVEMLNEARAARSLVCLSWFFSSSAGALCHTSLARSQMWVWHVGCMCFNTHLRNHASVSYSCLLLCSFSVWIRLVLWAEEIWGNVLLEKNKWFLLGKFFPLSPLLFLAMLSLYNSSPSHVLSPASVPNDGQEASQKENIVADF